VWVATLVRVLLLATAGAWWGADAALQVLHPYAGLTLDALVFVGMLRLARTFGLLPPTGRAATRPEATPPSTAHVVARLGIVLLVAATAMVADRAGAFGVPAPAAVQRAHQQTTLAALRAAD